MRCLIDANLPGARALLVPHAEVRTFATRQPAAADLAWAEVLWVRSVTAVAEPLLEQAPALRLVGTATIGTEHIDQQALAERGIAFVSAPGSNAQSVGQYVVTACGALSAERRGQRAVIVGAGHTGQAAGLALQALGLEVQYCDPPRAASGDISLPWVPLQAIEAADVVSLHVPLNRQGPHATWHLLDDQRIASLPAHSTLINASRGAVVDNQALLARLARQQDLQVALDVWEGEPDVCAALVPRVKIATPHIAGHSQEGKRRGVLMLYQALQASYPGHFPPRDEAAVQQPPERQPVRVTGSGSEALVNAMLQVYPIWRDDRQMRDQGLTATGFDQLRRRYPGRREFTAWQFDGPAELQPAARQLGFQLA